MEKFKAKSIDLKQMSNVRGGDDPVITNFDITIKITKKSAVIVDSDKQIEITGTVTIEK